MCVCRIVAAQLSDTGKYVCVAYNSLSRVLVGAELTVQGNSHTHSHIYCPVNGNGVQQGAVLSPVLFCLYIIIIIVIIIYSLKIGAGQQGRIYTTAHNIK